MAVQESVHEEWQYLGQPDSLLGCWQGSESQPTVCALTCAASVLSLRAVHLVSGKRWRRTFAQSMLPAVSGGEAVS